MTHLIVCQELILILLNVHNCTSTDLITSLTADTGCNRCCPHYINKLHASDSLPLSFSDTQVQDFPTADFFAHDNDVNDNYNDDDDDEDDNDGDGVDNASRSQTSTSVTRVRGRIAHFVNLIVHCKVHWVL